jgi:hypothetical protein
MVAAILSGGMQKALPIFAFCLLYSGRLSNAKFDSATGKIWPGVAPTILF